VEVTLDWTSVAQNNEQETTAGNRDDVYVRMRVIEYVWEFFLNRNYLHSVTAEC
jgi:hypothetical protein